jgi:hypothetical protein
VNIITFTEPIMRLVAERCLAGLAGLVSALLICGFTALLISP